MKRINFYYSREECRINNNIDELYSNLGNSIIISDEYNEKRKRKFAIINEMELEEFINRSDRKNFYEVTIPNKKTRLAFDLDASFDKNKNNNIFTEDEFNIIINNKDKYINNSIEIIKKVFFENFNIELYDLDILIFSSCTEIKFSYHIIIRNYYFHDWKSIGNYFYNSIPKNQLEFKLFDKAIYNDFKEFRLPLCSKFNKKNTKKLITNKSTPYKTQLVQSTFNERKIDLDITPEILEKVEIKTEISTNNNFEEIKNICLNLLDLKKRNNYNNWLQLAYALHDGGDEYYEIFEDLSIKMGYDTQQDQKERIKLWNDAKSSEKGYHINSIYYFLKEDNLLEFEKIQTQKKKSPTLDYYLPSYELPKRDNDIIYNERYVKLIKLEQIKTKGLILSSALGTGKSTILETFQNTGMSILALSSRQRFARSFSNRFKIDCYLDQKYNSDLLINSMESLHKIERNYDVIFFDECESCLSQFNSYETMKFIDENIKTFQRLIENAKYFICLDAFITNRTIGLFNILNIPYQLITNKWKQEKDAINIPSRYFEGNRKLFSSIKLEDKIIEKLKKNKKIYFFSSSKEVLEKFELRLIKEIPNLKYRLYKGSGNDYKSDFDDVNKTWSQYQLIMTTSTITVGINFDIKHFDYVFMWISGMACTIRDCFQSHFRVRNFKKLYYAINEKVIPNKEQNSTMEKFNNKLNKWGTLFENYERTNWYEYINIFNYMESNIQRSNSYSLTKIIDKYLDFCGYTIIRSNDEIEDQFTDKKVIVTKKYEDIPTISIEEFNKIYKLQILANSTESDKYKLTKYYFEKKFIKDNSYIKNLFNRNYIDKESIMLSIKNYNLHQKPNIRESNQLIASEKKVKRIIVSIIFEKLGIIDAFSPQIIERQKLQSLLEREGQYIFELMTECYGLRDQSKTKEISIKRFNGLFNQLVKKHFMSEFKQEKRKQKKINGKLTDISNLEYIPDKDLFEAKDLIKIN